MGLSEVKEHRNDGDSVAVISGYRLTQALHHRTQKTLPVGCLQLGGLKDVSFQSIGKYLDEQILWF